MTPWGWIRARMGRRAAPPRPGRLFDRQYFATLSGSAFVRLALAVAVTFASFGFLDDILILWSVPHWRALPAAALASAIAVVWLFVGTRGRKWLPAALLFQMAAYFLFKSLQRGPPRTLPLAQLHRRFEIDVLGVVACLTAGYILFLRFIRRQGADHLRLQTEIALAREVHDVLVPPVAHRNRRFEFFGRSLPWGEVGGDLIEVLPGEESAVCHVADVSGHGVPAGLLMGMHKAALRMRLASGGTLGEVLGDVNRVLHDLEKPGMFVTCACLRFAIAAAGAAGQAEYTLAGHLPILVCRARTRAIERLDLPQGPLGIEKDWRYTSAAVDFAPGDLFALVTDGLIETFDARGEPFGLERLEQCLARAADRPLEQVFDAALGAVARHGPRTDDQALLLIRAL